LLLSAGARSIFAADAVAAVGRWDGQTDGRPIYWAAVINVTTTCSSDSKRQLLLLHVYDADAASSALRTRSPDGAT